jgi:hypothetical protein
VVDLEIKNVQQYNDAHNVLSCLSIKREYGGLKLIPSSKARHARIEVIEAIKRFERVQRLIELTKRLWGIDDKS